MYKNMDAFLLGLAFSYREMSKNPAFFRHFFFGHCGEKDTKT